MAFEDTFSVLPEEEQKALLNLLISELRARHPDKRTDLVEAIFNDQEKWVPPGYEHTDHFIWRKMPKSPGNYVTGQKYFIPESEITPSAPWWQKA